MSKLHGDFGDLSRYDVHADFVADTVRLICQDCDRDIAEWRGNAPVPLDEITRAASEHETSEETDDGMPDDAVPLDRLDELARHYNER